MMFATRRVLRLCWFKPHLEDHARQVYVWTAVSKLLQREFGYGYAPALIHSGEESFPASAEHIRHSNADFQCLVGFEFVSPADRLGQLNPVALLQPSLELHSPIQRHQNHRIRRRRTADFTRLSETNKDEQRRTKTQPKPRPSSVQQKQPKTNCSPTP